MDLFQNNPIQRQFFNSFKWAEYSWNSFQTAFDIHAHWCIFLFKGAVPYFTHIFFSFFLAFLQTSYGFSLIETYKMHYFYLILYSETTNRGKITVTTTFTSGLDLCIFPCFKYIAYQIVFLRWLLNDFLRFLSSWCFFRPELSRFPPSSPSFEGAILDSKLENVGPTLSSLLCAEAYAWNMALVKKSVYWKFLILNIPMLYL